MIPSNLQLLNSGHAIFLLYNSICVHDTTATYVCNVSQLMLLIEFTTIFLSTVPLCVFPSSIFLNVTTSNNILDMELAPEGTVINVSCSYPNQVLVGVDSATCVAGTWSPDVGDLMCKGIIFLIINSYAITCHFNIIGKCGIPVAADGVVVIHNYTTTFEGSSISFSCEDDLFPSVTITATCTGEGQWSPNPATYICMDSIGKVSLTLHL